MAEQEQQTETRLIATVNVCDLYNEYHQVGPDAVEGQTVVCYLEGTDLEVPGKIVVIEAVEVVVGETTVPWLER